MNSNPLDEGILAYYHSIQALQTKVVESQAGLLGRVSQLTSSAIGAACLAWYAKDVLILNRKEVKPLERP